MSSAAVVAAAAADLEDLSDRRAYQTAVTAAAADTIDNCLVN
jgi:hypothetical protein